MPTIIDKGRAAALCFVLSAACGCSGATVGDSISIPTPELPESDGLLQNEALQAVVDLQIERDGAGLQDLLDSQDAGVRARSALALASVQDPTALERLAALLTDSFPRVRGNAAFALGQLALPDGGLLLATALAAEGDPHVRARLIEAVGKRGGTEALAELIRGENGPAEEPGRTLAVARAALREVRPPGVLDFLIDRLDHADPVVRSNAAYYLGRAASASAWGPYAEQVRTALDGFSPNERAAGYVAQGLARLNDVSEDADRLSHWMRTATDWRTRSDVARAVMSPRWLESTAIQEALLAALDDESEHVRVAAANSVALLTWSSEEYLARAVQWIQGPPENWRVQAAFAGPLAAQDHGDQVVDWTLRMAGYHPVAAVRGIENLGGLTGPDVTELIFELAEHADPGIRAAATVSLAQRWARQVAGDEPAERFYELFVRRLQDEENLPVARAAFSLSHPAFESLGAPQVLEEAFLARRSNGDENVLVPILEAMGSQSLTLLREVVEGEDAALRAGAARALERLTGEQVPIGGDGLSVTAPSVDWSELAALGNAPRVSIETDRGQIVVRLFPEQAPLSVQAFVRDVRRGAHDGTRFHRVVSNFVVQGGDYGLGDGSGMAGYQIRSEFTQLPFHRGTLGMASAGKDTEASQFYLMHSRQPHLDGGYSAFGWIEEGAGVLDLLQQGDQVLSMSLLE